MTNHKQPCTWTEATILQLSASSKFWNGSHVCTNLSKLHCTLQQAPQRFQYTSNQQNEMQSSVPPLAHWPRPTARGEWRDPGVAPRQRPLLLKLADNALDDLSSQPTAKDQPRLKHWAQLQLKKGVKWSAASHLPELSGLCGVKNRPDLVEVLH
jgi:hypothetical protein